MGLFFRTVGNLISTKSEFIAIYNGGCKTLMDVGFNFLQFNSSIKKMMKESVRNYYLNDFNEERLNEYDAAILMLYCIYSIVLDAGEEYTLSDIKIATKRLLERSDGNLKADISMMAYEMSF